MFCKAFSAVLKSGLKEPVLSW